MPLKLIPPRKGRSPNWTIRGTYLGKFIDRSTGASKRAVALQVLKGIDRDIERGAYAERGEATFASAAMSYMQAGGDRRFLKPYWSISVTDQSVRSTNLLSTRKRLLFTRQALQLPATDKSTPGLVRSYATVDTHRYPAPV